ncbi:MAG: hypothetical protein AVDCRST_MAG73-2514, partial [uncultured Thermomicrobiales bacterium]
CETTPPPIRAPPAGSSARTDRRCASGRAVPLPPRATGGSRAGASVATTPIGAPGQWASPERAAPEPLPA